MPMDRVTSVLGTGTNVKGRLSGRGGIRIEGAFEGDIEVRGLLVIGESGRVTSKLIQANIVVIAGIVKGDIHAEKVEIRATGRVWGDVETSAFATEEGAFLQGQITMEGLEAHTIEEYLLFDSAEDDKNTWVDISEFKEQKIKSRSSSWN